MIDGWSPPDDALWIRQSTVSSWELCPARVTQSTHRGFNGLPSEPMSFGTLVHEMLAKEMVDGPQPWTAADVEDFWDSLVVAEYGVTLPELTDDEQVKSSAVEAIGAVQTWRIQVQPTLPNSDPLVEARLEAPLGILDSGRQVWLHGTGDVLYPGVPVGYDWKTSGRDWMDGKAMALGQPSAYTYLALWNHDAFIADWRYWVFDRRSQMWRLHETSRTRQQVAAWLRHAFGIAKSIDAGATAYNPTGSSYGKIRRGWWCSPKYCGAWDICPGKYIADDLDETIEAEVVWQ